MKVTLGKKYKDSITGYEGIAVARAIYLYGCVRVMIIPDKLNKDGEFLTEVWFDEPQLISVRSKSVPKKASKKNAPGGPPRSVSPKRDPSRI